MLTLVSVAAWDDLLAGEPRSTSLEVYPRSFHRPSAQRQHNYLRLLKGTHDFLQPDVTGGELASVRRQEYPACELQFGFNEELHGVSYALVLVNELMKTVAIGHPVYLLKRRRTASSVIAA
jgi:hypothetical protein